MTRDRLMSIGLPADLRRPPAIRRSGVLAALARISGVLLGLAGIWFWIRVWTQADPAFPTRDINFYLEATRRWLETGTPYLAAELVGEFTYQELTFLHPPIALPLFLPFLVLPLALWWILPMGFIAGFVAWCRPAAWAWPLIGFAMVWYYTAIAVVAGNSDLWVAAFIAAGLPRGWPFALVVIKPSLAFFALLGVRHRSFWIAAGVLGIVSLLFGALWIDWLRVVLNSPGGAAYSLTSLPLMLLPVVAWLARRQR